jgi:hypothetical protein
VLLDEAQMPDPSELPESIRDFAYRNAADMESGRDFDVHVDRLIRAVEHILGPKVASRAAPSTSPPRESSTLVSPAPPTPPNTERWSSPWILGTLLVAAGASGLWFARDWLPFGERTDPTIGTAYCSDLKQVIVEARSNFVSILGRKTDPAGIWIARVQIAGLGQLHRRRLGNRG